MAGERIRDGQAVVLLGHVKCEILDFQVGTWERLPCQVVSLELTGGVRAGGVLWELSGTGDSKVMGTDQVSQEHRRRGLGTEPCGSLPFQVWKRRAQRREDVREGGLGECAGMAAGGRGPSGRKVVPAPRDRIWRINPEGEAYRGREGWWV